MAKADGLRYAENVLGVHKVHEQALEARKNLDDLYSRIDTLADEKRTLLADIQNREIEIISYERAANPEMSQAQMDRHLKVVNHQDGTLTKLRNELSNANSVLDGLELDVKICRVDIEIAVARLNELSGYFNYLAAIKTGARQLTPVSSTDDSPSDPQ